VLKFQKHINELIKYDKDEVIPNPEYSIRLSSSYLGKVYITRRTIAHIVQKEKVGMLLIGSVEQVIKSFNRIYFSRKNNISNSNRYILFKENISSKNIAVIVEVNKKVKTTYVITAMIADKKYLDRKYKKLR